MCLQRKNDFQQHQREARVQKKNPHVPYYLPWQASVTLQGELA
jgi:hypothetical protein